MALKKNLLFFWTILIKIIPLSVSIHGWFFLSFELLKVMVSVLSHLWANYLELFLIQGSVSKYLVSVLMILFRFTSFLFRVIIFLNVSMHFSFTNLIPMIKKKSFWVENWSLSQNKPIFHSDSADELKVKVDSINICKIFLQFVDPNCS